VEVLVVDLMVFVLVVVLVAWCGVSSVSGFGDRLDVTWPSFTSMPLTAQDAQNQGWSQIDSQCGTYGTRYMMGGDISLQLMFDSADNIAGVQVGVTTQPPSPITPPWEPQSDGSWTISLYFEDPDNVCNAGVRTETMLGDQLTLRNGNTGENIQFPLNESGVMSPWVQSPCFVSMGTHYWYNITQDMDCDYFYPVGLMYWDGVLVTFLVDIGLSEPGSRWEHPSGSALDFFFNADTMPSCLTASGKVLSTMHMFAYNPAFNTCL